MRERTCQAGFFCHCAEFESAVRDKMSTVIRKFLQRLHPVAVVTNVASCSHGYPIIYHIRRDWEIDHNSLGDYNLVVFSLYIISSVYNLSASLVLQLSF
jgi:hypothetical protein